MERISDEELFGFFMETLEHCGTFLLKMEPKDIEWNLFEEFDCGSISFLHDKSLNRMLAGQYISSDVYSLCRLLREKFRSIEDTKLWNVHSVLSNSEWYDVLSLSDKIKSMICKPY